MASSADGADGADGADDADDGREKIVDADARLKLGVARWRFFLAIHLGRAYEQPALWAHRLYPG